MSGSLIISVVVLLAITGIQGSVAVSDFAKWITKNNKTYGTADEFLERMKIFQENARKVEKHNAAGLPYTLELNQFADLTFEEFQQLYLLQAPQNCSATHTKRDDTLYRLPASVDWRKKGVVSPVKNQGECGSCWTFSTTGAMESHMAVKFDLHLSLSEQQLVDCAQAFNNKGCNGGLPSQAFEYIKYAPGLETEASYPYHAKDEKCHFDEKLAVAFVSDSVNITAKDEHQIEVAVANVGPVSIAFDVASDFQLYKSGVYTSTECKSGPMSVNHAVLAVGYGTQSGVPYWIVKNSWGASWGLKGYFLIERGKNMCGLADCASYPLVAKQP